MAIDTDAGLIIEIESKNTESGAKTTGLHMLVADDLKKPDPVFPYGLFPNKIMVLLIAAKNKLKGVSFKRGEEVTKVSLKGLVLPEGTTEPYDGLLTYSTLPFVYICENDLGRNGLTMPLYRLPSGDTLNGSVAVDLDRDSGGFFLKARSCSIPTSGYSELKISAEELGKLANQYNRDFLNSGVEAGDLPTQIYDNKWSTSMYLSGNMLCAEVLQEITQRWFSSASNIADYNIGAGLFLEQSTGSSTTYKPLASSLNIKSVNKAAHAEVRVAVLLDFLRAFKISGGHLFAANSPLQPYWADLSRASEAVNSLLAPTSGTIKKLSLFSSLLPCYMCLGNIETTVGGFIKSVNGKPVGMYATFNDVDQTALILDTSYYDIDGAVEYRNINIYGKNDPGSSTLLATVAPLHIGEPLSSNVRLSTDIDPTITIFPMSVSDAGSEKFGIGLQNDKSMWRYNLAAASLSLVHGKTSSLVIDETAPTHAHASQSADGKEKPRKPTEVYSYN